MTELDLGRTINQFEGVKISRRRALAWGGLAVLGGGVCLNSGVEIIKAGYQLSLRNDSFDKKYSVPDKVKREAIVYKQLQERANQLADKGNIDAANKITQSDEYRQANSAYLQDTAKERELQEALQKADQDFSNKRFFLFQDPLYHTVMLLGAGMTAVCSLISYIQSRESLHEERSGVKQRLEIFRPAWLDTPPDKKEIEVFDKAVSCLPPVGGKIPRTETSKLPVGFHGILPPTYTAEEQMHWINQFRNSGEMGEYYVHQLTVQGRLPDRFKYAGIALILHSPYEHNWNEPWIDSPWGYVGPMVHDGGKVNRSLNSRWKKVRGRTDLFLGFQIGKPKSNFDKNEMRLSNMEFLDYIEGNLREVELNVLEEQRTMESSEFYQRAALAMHAENGSAPRSIPEDVRYKAAGVWREFELGMKDLLERYGAQGVSEVRWFLDTPREIKGWTQHGKRFEADWDPIQRELINLEKVKKENPELRLGAAELIGSTKRRADKILGL
jgi:hypothetical protein